MILLLQRKVRNMHNWLVHNILVNRQNYLQLVERKKFVHWRTGKWSIQSRTFWITLSKILTFHLVVLVCVNGLTTLLCLLKKNSSGNLKGGCQLESNEVSRPNGGAWKNLGVFEVCWNIITLFRLQLRYKSMAKQYPPRSHWKQVAFMTSVMWKTECSYKQLTGLAFYHKIVLWLGNTFVAVPIFPFYRIVYLLVREHSWNF